MDDKLKEQLGQLTRQVKEKLAAEGIALNDEELDKVTGGAWEVRGTDINDWWCPYHKETHKGYRWETPRTIQMPDGRVAKIEIYMCGYNLIPYYLDTQSGQYYDENMEPIP